jgi:zinc transport system substrate-binding protein
MNKKIFLAAAIAFSFTIMTACTNTIKDKEKISRGDPANNSKLQVLVSFNPLREFAEAVGRDKVEVSTIVPEGIETHEFEPKAKDLERLSKAKVFVYNGLDMEQWVDKTLKSVDNKELIVVESSEAVDAIKISEEHREEDNESTLEHGNYDPHIWLSLVEAKKQTQNIKDALTKADPENKDFYEANYREFTSTLDEVYEKYKKRFDTLSNKNFVTGHEAFAYLCRDFGLKQNSVEGIFSEGEPTAKKLRELVDYCKENNIKVIFTEELASPKVSETLAKEVGAKVQEVYTIESKENNKNYIESMTENLENIYNSMK